MYKQIKPVKYYHRSEGASYNKWLPATLDSIRSQSSGDHIELLHGRYFFAKPHSAFRNSILVKCYHAWLILTSRAFAVQYAEDNIRMCGSFKKV
jgi:hypothetical protein